MDASALKEAFDSAVLWGCCLGLGGVALAALAFGLSRCPARVRAAVRRLGWPTVFVLGGFMAFATLEGSVTRACKERCAESAGGFFDRIGKVDRIVETDTPNASNPVNPVNSVKDPPRFPASNNSALSDSNLTLSSVTNLCFYEIEKGTDTVTLGVAWPDGLSLPNGGLDVFGHWQLAPDGWTRLAQVDVSGVQPPATVEIDVGSFPTDAMARTAFFRLAAQADTDGDGLSDAYEACMTYQVIVPPGTGDVVRVSYLASDYWMDGEGAVVGVQNKRVVSSDGYYNLTWDFAERGPILPRTTVEYRLGRGTDPLSADTDGDGLSDGQEVNVYRTTPTNADTDGDGLKDGEEVGRGTNPLATDSDGDGLLDGWEVAQGLDPVDASGENGASGDMDGDGLCNSDEQSLGTDSHAADSDGDGVSDFLEICNGSDPVDGGDGGKPSANFPYRGIRFDINGDYAAWSMTVAGLGPFDRLSDTFSMASPGAGSERLRVLKKGNSYRLTMQWLNSDGHTDPNWYCWQAKVNGLPTAPSYESYKAARLPGNEVVHGLGWMAENAGGLLTSHVHMREDQGGNVAEGLEATLHVYRCEVSICDPDDEAWPELAASRVLLDDEELRIRVTVTPAIADFDLFRRVMGSNVVVSTSGTCPTGVAIPVSASEFFVGGTNSEIRMTRTRAQLIELGLLPSQDEDGVDEMAWIDMANLAADSGQDLSDSEAFSSLGYEFRGKATLDSAKGLDSQPPNSISSESFFKAAGCEVVSAEYGGVRSSRRQIMNQADYFYYLGHGLHLYKSVDPGYGPETVNGHWNKDLKCVIFSACSILDINDYNNNYRWEPEEHNLSPGKYWEAVGPSVLLGYNYYAPADSSGAPARIMRSWVANRELLGDVDAWMEANKEQKKWNACAIRKGGDYVYFDSFMSVIHIKKTVKKEDW